MTHEGKETAGRHHLNFEEEIDKMYQEKLTAVYDHTVLDFKNRNVTLFVDARNKKEIVEI